jgi:FkbM family methyltransferase
MLGNRSLSSILTAFLNTQNYLSLIKIFKVCCNPLDILLRYIFIVGSYPHVVSVRTPIGKIKITLYCVDDILTLNEVFCREDYRVSNDIRSVVDMGANIGVSALYFLTCNPTVHCHLYEPVPHNLERLKQNIAPFADRVTLHPVAIGAREGEQQFSIESTGRYSGFSEFNTRKNTTTIAIPTCHVQQELDRILTEVGHIDVIKVDIEGAEQEVIEAIRADQYEKIGLVLYEVNVHSEGVVRLAGRQAAAKLAGV